MRLTLGGGGGGGEPFLLVVLFFPPALARGWALASGGALTTSTAGVEALAGTLVDALADALAGA